MRASKGRSAGVPNYKNELLINVIEGILPNGPALWQMVARRYQEVSGEMNIREVQDIRRHFTTHKNLCDNGKKVTGSSAPKESVARCQSIWRKILSRSAAANLGANDSGSDSENDSSSEYEESVQNRSLDNDSERPNIDNPLDGEDQSFVPINVAANPLIPAIPEDNIRHLEVPLIPRRAGPVRDPSPVPGQKRKQAVEEERGKSKNCRNHPRSSAGSALSSMAEAYTRKISDPPKNTSDSSVAQLMMMQMMQQNQQFQAQMMMMMMGPPRHNNFPPHSPRHYDYRDDSRRFQNNFPSSASTSSSSSYPNQMRNFFPDSSDISAPDDSNFDNDSSSSNQHN